jgi:hypothetical protein
VTGKRDVIGIDIDDLLAWQRARLKRSQPFQRHVKEWDIPHLAGRDALALELDSLLAWLASRASRGLYSRHHEGTGAMLPRCDCAFRE